VSLWDEITNMETIDFVQQFTLERDQFITSIKERMEVLDTYYAKLNSLIVKGQEYSELYKKEITNLQDSINQKKQELNSITQDHENVKNTHSEVIAHHTRELDRLQKSFTDTESNKINIDKTISGLMVEMRTVEKNLLNARGELSATQRHNTELKAENDSLLKEIGDNRNKIAVLKDEHSSLQKVHETLAQDAEILKNRN